MERMNGTNNGIQTQFHHMNVQTKELILSYESITCPSNEVVKFNPNSYGVLFPKHIALCISFPDHDLSNILDPSCVLHATYAITPTRFK